MQDKRLFINVMPANHIASPIRMPALFTATISKKHIATFGLKFDRPPIRILFAVEFFVDFIGETDACILIDAI